MTDQPVLSAQSVRRSFYGVAAVDGASFEVAQGSVTALVGPNGAGKTTMFNIITGFIRPDAGEVEFDGNPITGASPHRIARAGLVRTFQLTKAFDALSVRDNMLLGAQHQPGERLSSLWRPGRIRRAERSAREHAAELLERFALADKADEYAGALSGGQRKLLELARALMARPKLLLLDEPMAGINPALGERLFDYVLDLRDSSGLTSLFVEHDMNVVVSRSDTVIVMSQGSVIASGPPATVLRDPAVLDAYLGTPEETS